LNIISSKYRPEIDGLRAVAVLGVLINHLNKDILSSGFLGVDIFFVISGFVISSSLYGRDSENFIDFIKSFYIRRLRRIVPVLAVFIVVSSILICLFNSDPQITLRTGASSAFGLSNLYLIRHATDYFANDTNFNIFTNTWSLGVEEQFYFVYPFLIWFSGFSRLGKRSLRNLFIILIIFSVPSLSFYLHLYASNPDAAYFLMPTRFWEISSGGLTFILSRHKLVKKFKYRYLTEVLIFIILLLIMMLPREFINLSTILTVFCTSLFILLTKENFLSYKFLTNKFIIFIGKISYSLYLWHWTVICISRWTIGIKWWTIPIQILLSFSLAFFSYKYIEIPFRNKQYNFKKFGLLTFNIILVFSSSLIALFLSLNNSFLFSGQSRTFRAGNKWRYAIKSVNKEINGRKCHADIGYTKEKIDKLFDDCFIYNKSANKIDKTIAFVGDSHAQTLMSAQDIFYKRGLNLIHYTHAGCPFPPMEFGTLHSKCDQFIKSSSSKILNTLRQDDILVIYGYHLSYLGDQSHPSTRNTIFNKNNDISKNPYEKINIYMNSIKNFVQKANERGIQTYLITSSLRNTIPHPEWFRPFQVNSHNQNYLIERKNAISLNNIFMKNLSNLDGLFLINPLEELVVCCNNFKDFSKFYRDGNHLSDYGAKVLVNKLNNFIIQNETNHKNKL
tara:strand:- start:247 stop:2268 length:2022 start_codon:yes stop_codon:yes gene_type:complete